MSFDFGGLKSFCGCNKESDDTRNSRKRSLKTPNTESVQSYDYKKKYDAMRKENKELRQQLMKETERANGIYDALETKTLQVAALKNEISRIQNTLHDEDEKHLESEEALALKLRLSGRMSLRNVQTIQPQNEQLTTFNPSIIAHPNFIVDDAVRSINSWLKNTENIKEFKEKMAKLFTSCNAHQRGLILAKYPQLKKHLSQKLKKGNVLSLCNDFLFSSIASFHAFVIDLAIIEENFEQIGNVLCTLSDNEIRQTIAEYHRIFNGADLLKNVTDLCQRTQRESVRMIFESLIMCKRNESNLGVNPMFVDADVAFLAHTKRFKSDDKAKLIKIFCKNHWFYIRQIVQKYNELSPTQSLQQLISKTLGLSGSGHLTLILLIYSIDPIDFFCDILNNLGLKFDKNKSEIARIFLARSELDLNQIRNRFRSKYFSQGLDAWIEEKSKGSKFGYFLICILRAIDAHQSTATTKDHQILEQATLPTYINSEILSEMSPTPATEEQNASNHEHGDSLILDQVPITRARSVIGQNEESKFQSLPKYDSSRSVVGKKRDSKFPNKPKYDSFTLQNDIISNEEKREKSLNRVEGGFIKFLVKFMKAKSLDKVWSKIDIDNKGFVEMHNFPDLIAFIVLLFNAKMQQHTSKAKRVKIDNKKIREECEHLAVWIAKSFVYDDDNRFMLTKDEFRDNFTAWCEEYIDVEGAYIEFD